MASLFFVLAASAVLSLALALAACCWKTPASFRRSARHGALIAAGFGAVDLILFAALPRLNLSFGPPGLQLAVWWWMRLVLFSGWIGVSRLLLHRHKSRKPASTFFALLNLALIALLLYGFYYEPFNLGVTKLEQTADHAALSEPIRIAFVTDIHLERITRRERELISLVVEQQPDIILLGGDYLNLSNLEDGIAIEQARQLLAQFSAPLGVYAVKGNVDRAKHMEDLFEDLNITVLEDEVHEIRSGGGSLYLVGVSNRRAVRDSASLSALMQTVPPDAYTILLYHSPDLIQTAADAGVDLFFAGHTHGGQVRLPFYGSLVTLSRFGKRFEMGDYQVEGTRLYVSRGIGMEGSFAPRVRFLCPPEVVVMDLKGAE